MHDGMPYGRNQGQGHSREVDRQSPTGLIFYLFHSSISFLSFSSPPFPAPTPKIQLGSPRERCMLPQWVRAEPGRQTHFGAVEGQNFANHVNKLECS